jgi:hypothetical protein
MIRRELLEGSQPKEAEQVEPGQASSPYDDVLRQQLAFSGASSQDISGHADPGTAPFEWNEKYNRQIDQQAGTSGSGLKQGEVDQVIGKRKRDTENLRDLLKHPSHALAHEVLEKLEEQDIVRLCRSTDEGYKILSLLDGQKRRQVIDNFKDSDLVELFEALKTPDERKQFLRWTESEEALPNKYLPNMCLHYMRDTNKLKNFLRELDLEQIADLSADQGLTSCKDELCRALPLKYLKELKNVYGVDLGFEVRLNVECLDTLKTDNERKAFVRELPLKEVAALYEYWENELDKRKELCQLMARQDLLALEREFDCGEPERWVLDLAEKFNGLEPHQRTSFLDGHPIEQLKFLYRHYANDASRQEQLCRALPVENLTKLINKLSPEEGKVAWSCHPEYARSVGPQMLDRAHL